MGMVRWHDGDGAVVLWLFLRKWRQMWIFIKHNNVNKEILDHSSIPEAFIFLAYCCKIIKKISNAFYFFCLNINLTKMCVLSAVTHIPGRWRGGILYVGFIGWFYFNDWCHRITESSFHRPKHDGTIVRLWTTWPYQDSIIIQLLTVRGQRPENGSLALRQQICSSVKQNCCCLWSKSITVLFF